MPFDLCISAGPMLNFTGNGRRRADEAMGTRWIIEPLTSRDEIDNHGVSYFYLARNENRDIVGFCSFWRILDELHINNLAVAPAHRRSHAATELLTRVLEDGAKLGARRATLEVRRSNAPAQQLYERFGFSVAGVRRDYYSNPVEDALVLWREDFS